MSEKTKVGEVKFTVDDFYNFITSKMTPEQALKKLLTGTFYQYEKLKFDAGKAVHPEFICAMVAMDLGWQIAIEKDQKTVRGIAIGTAEYLNEVKLN